VVDGTSSFGTLLKRYRRLAHLTQEDLAERAGYSAHYVSMLERGVRVPQPLTADLLADALRLVMLERATLHAAIEAHPPPTAPLQGMPRPSLPLIGRQEDRARIVRVLRDDRVQLVTLTGPGGVGKTALSQQVALELAPAFQHGAAFVDFTAVSDPIDAIPTIARALTLRESAGRSIHERLIAVLQDQEILLLLDNFERVVEAAADVASLIAPCSRLKLLVTSRVPLRLQSEHEVRLRPLALPSHEVDQPSSAVLQSPAVALFVQRATLLKPDLVIDREQVAVVADICRRVDGLPLAIELAAARVTHLPLLPLRDRLQHRLQILTGGTSDRPTRQQRMRDTIAWSYDLLIPSHQALFRQLSVFAGSWSLEAAEEVCRPGQSTNEILDGMRSLVESSLAVLMDDVHSEPRYRMLDTIREYAAEQLVAVGELGAIQQRHAAYYVYLAEQAEPALQGRDQGVWYPRLEREHDNVRAALSWLLEVGDVESALRLAGAVWRFWQRHGDIREGRRWLEEGLTRGDQVSAEVQAKALWGASWLAYYQGDYARTRSLSIQHLALARDYNDALSTRNALTGMGMAALSEGRYGEAATALQEALDVCEPLGNIWHRATSFLNLGTATMLVGDLTQALALFEQALALYFERGDEVFAARTRQHLGYVALLQSEYKQAETLFARSLKAFFALGEKPGMADGLEAAAAVRAATGKAKESGQLVAAASVLRESIGIVPRTYLYPLWHPFVAKTETSLGAAAWATARQDGRAMLLEEAVQRAVDGAD
jgi:predicted ATPase/DNA-binding XRE family transcriptional regulator